MANIFNDFKYPLVQPNAASAASVPAVDVYAQYAQATPYLKEMGKSFQNAMNTPKFDMNSMLNQMMGGNAEIMQAMQNGNLESVARKMISEQGLDPDEFVRRVVQPALNG